MINKKISQFIEVQELDTTAYIPLIQGSPLYNAVIKPENLSIELSPFLDNLYIKVDGTNSNLDILKFNTNQPEQDLLVGELAYSQVEGTIEVGMNGGEVKQSLGLELYIRYKPTENILNGQLLMYDGTDGNSGVVKLKKATVGCDPKLIYGIATEDATNGGLHFATWYGKIKDINTSMYQAGNDLYQSTSVDGGLQPTQPAAPYNKASYAKVINAHSNQGTLFVKIHRSVSMNDINDAQITSATNGQALVYEDGVWKNKSTLGITDISPAGGQLNIAGTTVVEDLSADNIQSTGGFVKGGKDNQSLLLAGGGDILIQDLKAGIYQLYNPSNNTQVVLEINALGQVLISGDIIQNGSAYKIDAEEVTTKEQIITLRSDATTGMPIGDLAGFVIKKYDGVNDGMIVIDNAGVLRIGDVGDLQPVLTREEAPINNSPIVWDSINKRAKTTSTVLTSADSDDKILIQDNSDSNNPKLVTWGNLKQDAIETISRDQIFYIDDDEVSVTLRVGEYAVISEGTSPYATVTLRIN